MNDEIEKSWNLFLKSVQRNSEAQKLMKAVGNGTATYAEALEYSSLLSKLLVESVSEIYPTDSQKVLDTLKNVQFCKNYFNHIDKYLYDLQTSLNKGNNLGMKPVRMIRHNQLLEQDIFSSKDYKTDLARYKSKAELSSNKHVDTYQQLNAKIQNETGYKVTVSRTYDGVGLSDKRTCTWCLKRAKSNVPYDEAFKNGMFQRHEGCHCIIEYNNNGEKSYQTKKGGRKSFYKVEEEKKLKELEFEKKRRIAKSKNEHYDATEEWLYSGKFNKGVVSEQKEITIKNVTYVVDGKTVKLDHDDIEHNIADLIASKTGKDVILLPRVIHPAGIKCADYLIDDEKWDLKTPNRASKHTIYGLVHKEKEQAHCFVINLEKNKMALEDAIQQVNNEVFSSSHTAFVEKIMLVNGSEILKVFEK